MSNKSIQRIISRVRRRRSKYTAGVVPCLQYLAVDHVESDLKGNDEIDAWHEAHTRFLSAIQAAFYARKLLEVPLPLSHPEVAAELNEF